MIRLLWIALVCVVFPATTAQALEGKLPDGVRGSLCIVHTDNKLVMVREIFSRKLSLPGGTISNGEDPKLTAQRETWEEAGLVVEPVRKLGFTDTAVVFECVPQSKVVAFTSSEALKGKSMPAWFAPHFGIEVRYVMATDTLSVEPEEYRYPEQWPAIIQWVHEIQSYPIEYVDNLIKQSNSWQRAEFLILSASQTLSEKYTLLKAFLGGIVVLSNLILSPVALGISLIIAGWKGGVRLTQKLLFIQLITVLMAVVAKFGFALPAPGQFLGLVPEQNIGLSFPSVRAALLSATATFLLYLVSVNRINLYLSVVVMTLACLGMFLRYQVFITDIVFGALLGSLITRHFFKLAVQQNTQLAKITQTKTAWGVLTLCATIFASKWYATSLLQVAAVSAMVLLLMLVFRNRPLAKAKINPVLSLFAIVVGYFLSEYLHQLVSSHALLALMVEIAYMPLILTLIYIPSLIALKVKNRLA